MSGDHQSLIGFFAGALCCVGAFDCNLAFDKYGGIVLWILIMLYMFKALGTICDEYFVPSLEVIVDKLQLSNDVAGATFMAAGSSAPELFTSLVATFLIVNEGGVGTIVGSAIFNILVIVGATAWIACKDQSLKIWWYPLSRDCFFYLLSILELMLFLSDEHVKWYEALIMFLTYIVYCVYMKFNPKIVRMLGIKEPIKEDIVSTVEENADKIKVSPQSSPQAESATASNGSSGKLADESENTAANGTVTEVTDLRKSGSVGEAEDTEQPEMEGRETPGVVKSAEEEGRRSSNGSQENGERERGERPSVLLLVEQQGLDAPTVSPREQRRPSWGNAGLQKRDSQGSGQGPEDRPPPLIVAPDVEDPPKGWLQDPLNVLWEKTMPDPEKMGGGLLFALSIFFIGACTYVMVDSTNRVGVVLHIPPLAMALVFLAAGTSIPDALGSIAVAKQGEGDMAVANALGSNVFDILVGLGVPWFIKTGIMGKEVSFIGKWDELIYDIFVLVFVLILFVGCLIAYNWHLTRRVGVLLLMMYVCFLIYNVFAIWVIDPPLKEQAEQGHCDTL